jgi:selenophosphate synthase
VLGKLARQHDPNVLVGFDHADDAGVYQIAPDLALVQTVDFFTPIVDDPYTFGQIAATNSLSDVYAMGGRPLTGLALVCFPEKGDLEILERILAGGLSKMMEAACTIVGGHSIRDDETKFGYSVTGLIDPKRVLTNGGAKAGDALVLTKAIGTGVISTAIKQGKAELAWIDAAVTSMTTLNKKAAEVLLGGNSSSINSDAFVRTGGDATNHVRAAPGSPSRPPLAPWDGAALDCPEERSSSAGNRAELRSAGQPRAAVPTQIVQRWSVHSLTDITGFGLIGHAREMVLASNATLTLHADRVPFLEGAVECVQGGFIPGGLKANRKFAECIVEYSGNIADERKTLLFDPQTAGGLLISLPAPEADRLVAELSNLGLPAARIGEVEESPKPVIRVVP